MGTQIVTFSCSDKVHVYEEKCGVLPRSPYKQHETIEMAKDHLINRGVEFPEIIVNSNKKIKLCQKNQKN